MPRIGSRIRTVALAFPSQGPASLAATLAGSVMPIPRRFGRDRVIRGRRVVPELDIPQHPLLLGPPFAWPTDAGPRPAGGSSTSTSSAPTTRTPTSSSGCSDCP